MIQCQACHYQALGPIDLAGHIQAVHGFGQQEARAEAARIAGAILRCSRCGAALDNVSPGFSIVAGGARVCANCLKPGEEIARARGIR